MGDHLLRAFSSFSIRPALVLPLGFALIWVAVTLGLHYIPRPGNDGIHDVTFTWGGSVGIAFFVAIVGTILTHFIHYRRSR